MRVINFNINDYVKVKLTDYGRECLKKDHNEFWDMIIEKFSKVKKPDYVSPKEDKNGWSKWQMWSLMEKLGKHFTMDFGTNTFETDIKIEVK